MFGEVVRILGQAGQAPGRMASRKTLFSRSPAFVVLLRIPIGSFKYDSRSESGHSVRDTITNAISDTSDIVVVAPLLNSEEKVPKLR